MLAVIARAWAACVAWAACGTWAASLPLQAERLRAGVGGFAVMNCHLDFPFGNRIPYQLQWDKDGETIFSWYSGDAEPVVADRWGGRVRRVGGVGGADEALGGGSINVSAVRESDAGLYRCRVSFPNRTPPARNNGTFYRLDVDGGNLIVTPPVNATVLEGERAELQCRPGDAAWRVRWTRDGAPLDALPELRARADTPPNGSLVLRAASSADPGEYACRVSAPDGAAQEASAFLDVQYKAKVVYAPSERHLPYGKPASLDCHFSANPPLTNLRWEKDGFLFDPYNVPGVFYSRNGSLLFNEVEESHEGEYSCTPYNALGSAGASPRVRVRVQRPPALAVRPPPLHLTRLGAAASLPCVPAGAGDDPPALAWTRKDGAPLPAGRHSLDGGNLTVADVTEEDGGVYVCTVSNAAAALSAESELRVENAPPRAPQRLSARAAPRALHVAWRAGGGAGGRDAEYTVWYRERGAPAAEWRTMRILSRGVTEATLLGLRPATEYELRVLAQDRIGDGLFSRPLVARTLEPEAGPDAEGAEDGESAGAAERAAATTASAAAEEPDGDGEGEGGADELQVSVRLLDEGALVRWRRAPLDESRCTVRWREEAAPALTPAPPALHTHHDYALVGPVREGARYSVRVQCASGARGGAALSVPEYSRLRGVAGGAAAAAMLLAALAAALLLARRRRRGRRARCAAPAPAIAPARAPPPPPPPRADARRR